MAIVLALTLTPTPSLQFSKGPVVPYDSWVKRRVGQRFPDGFHIGSFEVSCSVPTPAPD